MLPAGTAESGRPQSDAFAWQVPAVVEIGAKPIPELFVGATAGFAWGPVAGTLDAACRAEGLSCASNAYRVGLEAILYLLPSRRLDPWVGYGIGYESTTLAYAKGRTSTSESYSGIELAHLMAGMDVRISRSVGIGPLVDVALGMYTGHSQDRTATRAPAERDVDGTVHAWVTLGARLVLFP